MKNKLKYQLIITYLFMTILDIISTSIFISKGGFEANPFFKYFFKYSNAYMVLALLCLFFVSVVVMYAFDFLDKKLVGKEQKFYRGIAYSLIIFGVIIRIYYVYKTVEYIGYL